MNTITLAVPVVVGLEVSAALGLAWLCWRLAQRRNLLALRDIARAFVALAVMALTQLLNFDSLSGVQLALPELARSLALWMYLGFMVLGAAELATGNFVTGRVRRDAVLGALAAAVLTLIISRFAGRNALTEDLIRNAITAGGTGIACIIIARVVDNAAAPPRMVLGAGVVRVALTMVAMCATLRAGIAILHSSGALPGDVDWAPILTVEFISHCALCVGLVIWILDRDWALADATIASAEHRAAMDALTGLPNRTVVLDRLDMAVAAAKRNGTIVGVLFVDLDDFKDVNDSHGHAAGDAVLQAMGATFSGLLRASDTFGRMGGDEFVAISPQLRSEADLAIVVAKVRHALRRVVMHEGTAIDVDGSVGAALFPRDGDTPAAVLASADAALYRDKALRRTTRAGVLTA